MLRYVSFAGRSLNTVKWNHSILTQFHKGLVCSSANFASDSKKKGSFGGGALRKNSNNTSKAPLLNPATEKIVQIRENTTTSKPPPPLSTCPPPPLNPCPPPPPHRQSPPPNNRNKALIALLVGAASIGGLYYAGVFDSGETKKVKPLFIEEQKKKWRPRKVIRNPPKKEDFPAKIPYVLVGGGTASFAAFRAIKSKDSTAKVLVIASEDSLPYMRPPLSKEIWHQNDLPPAEKLIFKQWNGQERSLYYEPPEFYLDMAELETAPHGGVVVATGWVVSKIDANSNTIEIEDPETKSCFCLEYEKCLIATGSRPKNLPIFEESPEPVKRKLILYRNIRDLEDLWQRLEGATSVAIVGGGFLGSELACSLARKYKNTGTKVHQVFKETGNMGRVLPEYLSEWTTERIIEEGVNVIPAVEVKDADISGDQVVLTLSNDNGVRADVVVIAVGSEANTQLAETSSLEVHPTFGGFLVNAELEARTNLYVAGDAACFYDPILGRRRVEHHDHAVVSGRLAGENMAGSTKPYKHQSMFWSDLGHDVGYEAIGIVDSCLPTVAVFAKGAPENRTNRMDDVSEDTQKAAESTTTTPELTIKNVEYVKPENVDDDICKDNKKETPVASTETSVTDKVDTSIQVVTQESAEKSDDKDYNKGIIFYLRDNMIVGIVLWNVFNRMHIARQILAERRKYEDLNEVAKLFSLHED